VSFSSTIADHTARSSPHKQRFSLFHLSSRPCISMLALQRLHQWSQKPKPNVTSAQRVARSLAVQTSIQNKEGHVSILGSPGCSLWVDLFCGRQTIHECPTKNLSGWPIALSLFLCHGSRFPLAKVDSKWNQGMAKRLRAHPNRFVWSGAPPNGPVWTGPAVGDPKLEQSRVMGTRSIRRLEYVRMVNFWTVTP